MSTNYRINDTTKWGMLILAMFFDLTQFLTPYFLDLAISGLAAIVFGMIFIEKGALKTSGGGALRIFRLLMPFAEVFMSVLPGITLQVWIMVYISRIQDRLPPIVTKSLAVRKIGGKTASGISKSSRKIRQLAKYSYGKGKRGVRTLARKVR